MLTNQKSLSFLHQSTLPRFPLRLQIVSLSPDTFTYSFFHAGRSNERAPLSEVFDNIGRESDTTEISQRSE